MSARKRGHLSDDRFDALVARALETVPERFKPYLENVLVVSQDRPSRGTLRGMGIPKEEGLYGLYEGVPLTERGAEEPLFPATVTIFREPLLEDFGDDEEEIIRQIRITVLHEIGHHFGLGDDRMEDDD